MPQGRGDSISATAGPQYYGSNCAGPVDQTRGAQPMASQQPTTLYVVGENAQQTLAAIGRGADRNRLAVIKKRIVLARFSLVVL